MNNNAQPEQIEKIAENYFRSGGYNCAESVLKTLMEELELDVPPETLKAATGFGGGIGGTGCTCGALAGGVMAIGLVCGRTEAGDPSAAVARGLSGELQRMFSQRHGSTCCRVLTRALERGTQERKDRCAVLTGEMAREAAALILAQVRKKEETD